MRQFSNINKIQVDIGLCELLDKDAIDRINFRRNRGTFTHHLNVLKLALQEIETG